MLPVCYPQATSALRKEQENEVMHMERMREHRKYAQEADLRFSDASKRLAEMKKSGIRNQTAEQILGKLQQDVRELNDRRENVERIMSERESHLEKLKSWDNMDRVTTDEDVRMKREEMHELEGAISTLRQRLDGALERNQKLVVFRQASSMAMKKYREREDEVDKLQEELRRLQKQIEEKDAEMNAQGRGSGGGGGKLAKRDLKKYGAVVREKIEKYKKMREELAALRSELVVLQRTEQILKSRHGNLEQFLSELERQKGVEVRARQRTAFLFLCVAQHASIASIGNDYVMTSSLLLFHILYCIYFILMLSLLLLLLLLLRFIS